MLRPDHAKADMPLGGRTSTDLQGKVALVTGGAGGMGRAHALRLARCGADVAIIDIDLDVGRKRGEPIGADGVAGEIGRLGVRTLALTADLADAAQAKRAIDEIARTFGGIDILVNNVGGALTPMERSTASQTPPEDARLLFAVNFDTMMHCCQAATPHMRRPGGSIINLSTAAVDRDLSSGRIALYAAAKAAVLRYSRSLAVELGPDGIRVNCIAPGFIQTARMSAAAASRNLGTTDQARSIPLRRLGRPEDISGVVEFLASDLAAYVTGECIRATGGSTLVGAN